MGRATRAPCTEWRGTAHSPSSNASTTRWVNLDLGSDTLLTLAHSNSDTTQRVAIAHRLLDDGADVLRERPLHVLVGRNDHDFVNEALLLERMLEQGADVNEIYPGFGTPLETIAAKFKFSDVQLAPFYDVLLARPDLDLLQQSLADRGIPIPPARAVGQHAHGPRDESQVADTSHQVRSLALAAIKTDHWLAHDSEDKTHLNRRPAVATFTQFSLIEDATVRAAGLGPGRGSPEQRVARNLR